MPYSRAILPPMIFCLTSAVRSTPYAGCSSSGSWNAITSSRCQCGDQLGCPTGLPGAGGAASSLCHSPVTVVSRIPGASRPASQRGQRCQGQHPRRPSQEPSPDGRPYGPRVACWGPMPGPRSAGTSPPSATVSLPGGGPERGHRPWLGGAAKRSYRHPPRYLPAAFAEAFEPPGADPEERCAERKFWRGVTPSATATVPR
jgi:hypothetical protein